MKVLEGGVYLHRPLWRLVVLSKSTCGKRKRVPVGDGVRKERNAGFEARTPKEA